MGRNKFILSKFSQKIMNTASGNDNTRQTEQNQNNLILGGETAEDMVRQSRTDLFKGDGQKPAESPEQPPTTDDTAAKKDVAQQPEKSPWYARILCCSGKADDKAITQNVVGKGLLTNAGIIQQEQQGPGNQVGKGLLKHANIDTTQNGK